MWLFLKIEFLQNLDIVIKDIFCKSKDGILIIPFFLYLNKIWWNFFKSQWIGLLKIQKFLILKNFWIYFIDPSENISSELRFIKQESFFL